MNLNLLIGGQAVEATRGATFSRLNPVTGQVASTAAAASTTDACHAVDAAQAAFAAWSETGPSARRAILLKAADLLQAKTPEFTDAMINETGSTGPWAGFNVMFAASLLREAASMTTQISGEVIPSDKPGCMAMSIRQPAGVCLGIAPWNAPVILGVRAVAMPLACGNTVVLKASEMCPRTHHLIVQVLQEAGCPPGVVNLITNAPEDAASIVDALIAHPAVKRVNFTGSTKVGRIIAGKCAHLLKPVLLELGGKAPLLVLGDADIDEAVNAAAFGAFMNQGQICMSTERIIVVDAVADAFVKKFAAKAKSLPAGKPTGPVVLGSVVSTPACDHVMDLIDDAVAKGATLASPPERQGTIMKACVLDHVQSDMRIYSEESFGPVVSVIRVKDEDEAVRVANDSEYGLSAAVFSKDIIKALGVAKRIQSGICHINGPTVHDEGQMPFGGVKSSGWGRFGGQAAVAEFTDLRWITIETQPGHYPF